MTDYEYIFKQVLRFHFTTWDIGEYNKCVEMLPKLSRQELTTLYYSKWVKEDKKFRDAVFKALFINKVGKREQRIKELKTEDLIEEFKDKKSGNVALIRKEMHDRYKANKGNDRALIATAFNASIKGDQAWVQSQIRKERDGDSNNNYQWKKPSWK